MKVKVKKINPNAQLPKKSKPGDFCYDVWAVTEEEIAPNIWRYGLGFKYEIIRDLKFYDKGLFGLAFLPGYELEDFDISIDFRPRSSIFEHGMSLANSPGSLDEFYRGEAKAIFYHIFPNMERYHIGDKIGQIKIGIAPKVIFEFADEINEDTERGDGGFGSTGQK